MLLKTNIAFIFCVLVDFGRQHTQTKFPVILPCNHTVCESCLFLAVKNRTNFTCSICKVSLFLHLHINIFLHYKINII